MKQIIYLDKKNVDNLLMILSVTNYLCSTFLLIRLIFEIVQESIELKKSWFTGTDCAKKINY